MPFGGEKKQKPKASIGFEFDLSGLLDTMGLGKMADRVINMIKEGKLEVRVEFGGKKKGKLPATVTIRLKKAEP